MPKGLTHSKTAVEKESRVEALRKRLGYPIKQRDPQGSDFFYLHPGNSVAEAEETAPIAVGFYPELNELTDQREIQRLLMSKEWQQRIYWHYSSRKLEHQPVMYLLLPTEEGNGSVPLVLPTEGGLRQRNIQSFALNSPELETRLDRLQQGNLPIASKALISIPLVERAFYEPIKTAKELAQRLAEAARQIEQVIPKVYQDEERRYPASKSEEGYLHKLLRSFQQELLPTLRLASENEKDYSFADIYAQTIAYSLFTARVFSYVRDQRQGNLKETLFDRESAWQQLPETNPFLRRLFQDISEQKAEDLGDELIGAIADIFTILRAAKMDVILQDFRQRQNREDIVIRFYEDFLAAYKPKMRERRGVYYTPEPVVSYMVRSVDVLLKEKFNKPLGLADPEVMILDPACGTGTFLLWICQLIHDRFHTERAAIVAQVGDISWSEYVSNHLLPRIFGFELLMAPYAIAHLKLGLFFEETGYQFNSGKRLGVYLTNSLEQDSFSKPEISYEEFISCEGKAALTIKQNESIMLVIGNPPYSSSIFEGEWIMNLIQDYKKKLKEQKSDLNREEWKFLRFAQHKIDNSGHGIVSFVINNTFVDAITHRVMRRSLTSSFQHTYILDLHGSADKREKTQEGLPDKNIFDIKQGVSVMLAAKTEKSMNESRNFYEIYGDRDFKYSFLERKNVKTTEWLASKPNNTDYHFFHQNDLQLKSEYEKYLAIDCVFNTSASGVQTKRDELVTDLCFKSLAGRMKEILDSTVDEESIREKYQIEDSSGWSLSKARRAKFSINQIKSYIIRPFDHRFVYYDRSVLGRDRFKDIRHILEENLGLVLMKQVSLHQDVYSQLFVSENLIADRSLYSNRGTPYIFPLYLYPETQVEKSMGITRCPNFSQSFINSVTDRLGYTPTPEAIFYYIYAIFHSPTYRSRYAEFLKIDFPRVPLTCNDALFCQLAGYGEELVALHLMKSPKLDQLITQFVEQGGKAIVDPAHPKYANGKVTINKKGDGFVGVPEAVWNFYVGGYPVCAKWLKDRKGRTLSSEDIAHYQRIVVALGETIRLMAAIDQTIPGFPIS